MAENTKIEWADHTFNPWEGCQKVGPSCDHCYAESRNARVNWLLPLKWNREAAESGIRPRVFCASLADVFDNAVPAQWRADLIDLIAETPHLDWLLLTKRIGNAHQMLIDATNHAAGWTALPNIWIGATICNQEEADRDIPMLLAVHSAKRFLSIEPMLGPVSFSDHHDWLGRSDGGMLCPDCPERGVGIDPAEHNDCLGEVENAAPYIGIDWVIVGGESGPDARPMHPDWVRNLRDQCQSAGVPFLFKQWGEWSPYAEATKNSVWVALDGSGAVGIESEAGEELWNNALSKSLKTKYALVTKVGKNTAGRVLNRCIWDEIPK